MRKTNLNENNLDLLMQSKHLVHTSYEVTAIQNRIFYYCLLSAQREKNGELSCEIKVDDIKNLIPNKNQRTLANLKKSLQILKQTSLVFEKTEKGDDIECDYNLIAGFEYNKTKEIFNVKLADRLYRHLIDYTVYAPLNFDILTRYKSFYSQRLYELLRLWSRTDKNITKGFKIEQLRFILGSENKYPEYKNFKQRVINQAIKEINEYGNMNVSINEIKNGKKVEEIEFEILDYEKKVYFKNNGTRPNTENNINFDIKDNIKVIEQKENGNNKEFDTTEAFEVENNTNIVSTVKETLKIENKEFYIPDEDVFTKGTLRLFKKDFKEYNFKEQILNDAFEDALAITFEKDDVEIIETKSYKYFKGSLENKIQEYRAEHQADEKHKEEMDKYWN